MLAEVLVEVGVELEAIRPGDEEELAGFGGEEGPRLVARPGREALLDRDHGELAVSVLGREADGDGEAAEAGQPLAKDAVLAAAAGEAEGAEEFAQAIEADRGPALEGEGLDPAEEGAVRAEGKRLPWG